MSLSSSSSCPTSPVDQPSSDDAPIPAQPHDDDAAAENAASDDFAVADRDSGADQLLSTAFPDGLSNPFSSAQGGWDVGLQSANSDMDVATGGNPNAFTGGENINPYTGLSTDAANSNSFTGQSSDDSLDDPQNAWSTSGRGGMDTRGMLALKDPLNAGNIATDATMDFSSGQRGGYASAGGTPDTVASNGSVSTPSSHDDKAISNSVNSANLGPDTVGGIRVEQSQPYLLNGIQTIDVVVSSPGSTNALPPASTQFGPPSSAAPAPTLTLGPPSTHLGLESSNTSPIPFFGPLPTSSDWRPFEMFDNPSMTFYRQIPSGFGSGSLPAQQPNWLSRTTSPPMVAGITGGGLFPSPLSPGPLNFPSSPGSPLRVPGFGPESFKYPFGEPITPTPAGLPSSPGVPVSEPPPAAGLLDEALGVLGDVAGGALIILTLGATIPGDTALRPVKGTKTVQDLVNAGWQYHHWFPQEFEDEFDELGIDVHQFTTLIPLDLHIALHNAGLDEEGWNNNWQDWLDDAIANGYTAEDAGAHLFEILQPYLKWLEDAGIMGPNGLNAIVPYPGQK